METPSIYRIPTRAIFERAAATATDSNGCVECTGTVSPCPDCGKGEQCIQVSQTCHNCAQNVCSSIPGSSSGSSSTNIGAIVGGVIGGLAVLAILGFIYWKFFFKKKQNINLNDKEFSSFNDDTTGSFNGTGTTKVSDQTFANRKSHRLSSYDSFTKPTGLLNEPGKRDSVATTISTTNASNILPIAYIPGVTVRPNKNNTKSVYSVDDSIFSDMNTIENASIVGEKIGNTMTAIKARPRLVNVAEDDEEEDEEEEEDGPVRSNSTVSGPGKSKLSNVNMFDTIEEVNDDEDDSDSDSDSDLGSIHKNGNFLSREILIDQGANNNTLTDLPLDFERPGMTSTPANRNSTASNVGSFVLEVDLDPESQDQSVKKDSADSVASKKSPFDDDYKDE